MTITFHTSFHLYVTYEKSFKFLKTHRIYEVSSKNYKLGGSDHFGSSTVKSQPAVLSRIRPVRTSKRQMSRRPESLVYVSAVHNACFAGWERSQALRILGSVEVAAGREDAVAPNARFMSPGRLAQRRKRKRSSTKEIFNGLRFWLLVRVWGDARHVFLGCRLPSVAFLHAYVTLLA